MPSLTESRRGALGGMTAPAPSGGAENRAVLARLFNKPANLPVLDEPTNDLDMETL